MANQEQVEILKKGAEVWNAWRQENMVVLPDLSRADLSRADLCAAFLYSANLYSADLTGANLTGANLTRADLTRADLFGVNLTVANLTVANLTGANLTQADLTKALLYSANLRGADLTRADFTQADLTRAILTRANLTQADLNEANVEKAFLTETVFANTNLSGTKGLDQCVHQGPSVLDHRTLVRSGDLPMTFLRGCGLQDWQIESAKLLSPNLTASQVTDIGYEVIRLRSDPAIQFHSCFISYSSDDDDFARRLHDGLQNTGVRCWFAPEDLKIGDKIRHVIDDAIRLHDKLLLILSQPAIDSGWVAYEADRALSRELLDKRTILFPIRLDDSVFDVNEGWALHIKEDRHIGDFTDHDQYNESFQRLLRDLKA